MTIIPTKPLNALFSEWLDDDDAQGDRIAVFVWCEHCSVYAEMLSPLPRRMVRCPLCGRALRAKAEPELYANAN